MINFKKLIFLFTQYFVKENHLHCFQVTQRIFTYILDAGRDDGNL